MTSLIAHTTAHAMQIRQFVRPPSVARRRGLTRGPAWMVAQVARRPNALALVVVSMTAAGDNWRLVEVACASFESGGSGYGGSQRRSWPCWSWSALDSQRLGASPIGQGKLAGVYDLESDVDQPSVAVLAGDPQGVECLLRSNDACSSRCRSLPRSCG